MAASKRRLGPLVALAVLAIAGFTVGAVAGIIWEEPRLVLAYLTGDTTEITWSADAIPAARDLDAAGAELAAQTAKPVPEVVLPAADAVEVARPKPPAVAAAPPAATGPVAIQVGAFAHSESAERLATRLSERGYAAYVTPGASAGEARWRVRVGPMRDRDEADRVAARLKREEKLPTWVLAEDGG